MKKIIFVLLLSLFLFSSAHSFNPIVVCGGVPVVGGAATSCVGYPNTACVPDQDPTTPFGTDGDRTYCHPWTATEGGTITAIKLRIAGYVNSEGYSWAVVFNGTTLVGYQQIPSDATQDAWTTFDSLTTVTSLAFSTDDVLCFGVQYDGGGGDYTQPEAGNAGDLVNYKYSSAETITTAPMDVSSWSTSGSYDMGAILEYTPD